MVERSVILNAFKPNMEIDDPRGFSGRRQQIINLADTLLAAKSCPIIYGSRGLGKTSLALQVARIALGDVTLLQEFGADQHALGAADRFTVFWTKCSSKTRDNEAVLQRIINTAEGFSSLKDLESWKVKRRERKHRLNLRVYEFSTATHQEIQRAELHSVLSTEEKLGHVIARLQREGHVRILFVIDELDRVASTEGLADFLRNESTADVKFLLVGIGHDVSSLLADHESLHRQIVQVLVEPMTVEELEGIIDKSLRLLLLGGVVMKFSKAARSRLMNAAAGLPWFIHVLGQESLRRAWDDNRSTIEEWDVEAAMKTLAQNRFAQSFSDLYQRAVRGSRRREILLRLLAKWPFDDVPLRDINRIARRIGVGNPHTAKSDLMKARCGRVLLDPPDHEKGIVRFGDAMFKRYVDITDSIFSDAKDVVDEAWLAEIQRKQIAARSDDSRTPPLHRSRFAGR